MENNGIIAAIFTAVGVAITAAFKWATSRPTVLTNVIQTLTTELDRIHHMRANEKTIWLGEMEILKEQLDVLTGKVDEQRSMIEELMLENAELRRALESPMYIDRRKREYHDLSTTRVPDRHLEEKARLPHEGTGPNAAP